MASRANAFVVSALLGLGVMVNCAWAQTEPAAPATRPSAATTRPAGAILNVVPADAWGAVVLNNLNSLDTEIVQLTGRLGLPIMVMPSTMLPAVLGLPQGVDPAGGMAMIFMDRVKYGQSRNWQLFGDMPAPVVLAVAARDPQALIKAMQGQAGEVEGVWSVTLQDEELFAAVKSGYVVLAPDAELVQAVAGAGVPATQPARSVLQPGAIRQMAGADFYAYVNVKPIAEAVDPIVRGMLMMMGAAAPAAEGAEAGTAMGAATAGAYFDILSKQVDKLVVLGDLQGQGLLLSALVTFQPDTVLAKALAALEPAEGSLLAGLPDGTFVVAGGGIQTGKQYSRQIAELFSKPVIESMRGSGSPALQAAATQQAKMMDIQLQLEKLQQSSSFAAYMQPKGAEGSLTMVVSGRYTDAAKAYELVQQLVKMQVQSMLAQAPTPDAQRVLEAVTYTPDAETVNGAKVHTLLVDMTKLADVADLGEDDMQTFMSVLKTLFGTEGLTIRVAVTDKDIVATIGGGKEFLAKALAAAKANAAPLAKAPAIAKVDDRLPENRVFVSYLSVENILTVVNEVAIATGEGPLPFDPGTTSAPVAVAMLADPVGLHMAAYVPTELIVSIKNKAMQAQSPQRRPGMRPAPATQPQEDEEEEPAPAEPAPSPEF